jgi:predicted acylesterase/phospholipase RssA
MATAALAYAEVLDLVARGRDSAVYIQILRLGARLENVVVTDSCLNRIRSELNQAMLARLDVPTARENLDQFTRRLEANHRLIIINEPMSDEARRLRAANPDDQAIPPEDWALYAALVQMQLDVTIIAGSAPRALAGRLRFSQPEQSAPAAYGRALFDTRRNLRVLCITGGGYKGLFAARVLRRLEQTIRDRAGAEARIGDLYGLYVGTSIGAILCSAVALGVPARRIERYFANRRVARLIFARSAMSRTVSVLATALCLVGTGLIVVAGLQGGAATGDLATRALAIGSFTTTVTILLALTIAMTTLSLAGIQAPHVFRTKYRNDGLRRVIERIFGADAKRRLRDISVPLAIVATIYNTARPHVFRSAGLDPHQPSDATLCDALMASAAAPTFFPSYRIGHASFIDGGVVANVPDVIGVCDAIGRLYSSNLSACMLSIGTASEDRSGGPVAPGAAGAFMWFTRHNLLGKIFAAQEALAENLAETLLDDRYVRVNLKPNRKFVRHLAQLDRYSTVTRRSLVALADEAWERAFDAIRRARLAG